MRRLEPYEWEASAADVAAATGLPESAIVHFDTNTAPWPPVGWEQTVLDVPRLPANEYPHPSNEPLRSRLAERLAVAPNQVVVTCGADEALHLAASAYLGPRRRAVMADPSFAMFRVVTEATGSEIIRVPVDDAWDMPLEPTLEAVRKPGVALAWLCSPNNPTGRLLDAEFVMAVARAAPDVLVVVDEAYHEVSGVTLAHLLSRYSNLLLVRTFSKGYGLAGARVGYAVGQPDVIRLLNAVRPPQNVTAFGIAAAGRALADEAGLRARVALLHAERERMERELEARQWTLVPSTANFLLGRPPAPADQVSTWLQGAGLIVRSYGGHPRLAEWLRVTVRAPEENTRLLARLDARLAPPPAVEAAVLTAR